MDKKKKKTLAVIIIIAAVIAVNIVISALFRPIGPALYADAYIKGLQVEKMLERQYSDDDFMLVSAVVSRSDLLDGLKPNGYDYTFKSKKCKNELVYAYSDLKIKEVYDCYLHARYKDEAKKLIEKSLNSYFGEGHYCYYIYTSDDAPYYKTGAKAYDIYYYIGHKYWNINIIADASFDKKDKEKVENEIFANLNSTFDTASTPISIDILFDKDDDEAIPQKTELSSNEFFDYYGLDFWDERLQIENEELDYKADKYSPLQSEWKTNDRKRFKYQTKNTFLNGADVKAVINGFEFTPDGSVTFKEFLNKTGYDYYNATVDAKKYNPNDVAVVDIGKKGAGSKANLGVVNKTGNDTALENGSIYAVSIGFSHEVETELFKDCSVCGLKIGDEMTEEELVKAFGPYEEKKIQENNEVRFNFVDGTEIGYATRDAYRKMLSVILQNGRIRFVSCSYYETDNRYTQYHND